MFKNVLSCFQTWQHFRMIWSAFMSPACLCHNTELTYSGMTVTLFDDCVLAETKSVSPWNTSETCPFMLTSVWLYKHMHVLTCISLLASHYWSSMKKATTTKFVNPNPHTHNNPHYALQRISQTIFFSLLSSFFSFFVRFPLIIKRPPPLNFHRIWEEAL